MDLFDPRLIEAFHRLARVAWRLPGGGILGRPAGKLPAGGTELSGYRDYSPGDDYRQVDWRLCARHDELLTRQYRGQSDLRTYLLLDCSRSMGLGRPARFDVARQVAAALGYLALRGGHQVGVAAFADTLLEECPSVGHWARLLVWLSRLQLVPGTTCLSTTATLFTRRPRRRGIVLVLSDFYDPEAGAGLDILRHEGYLPRLVRLCDPAEAQPSARGDVELQDVESGRSQRMTITEKVLKRYTALHHQQQCRLRQRGMPLVEVDVTLPLAEQLLAAIGGRGLGDGETPRRAVSTRPSTWRLEGHRGR